MHYFVLMFIWICCWVFRFRLGIWDFLSWISNVLMFILFLLVVVVNVGPFSDYIHTTSLLIVFPECLYLRSLRVHFVNGKFAARYKVGAFGLDQRMTRGRSRRVDMP